MSQYGKFGGNDSWGDQSALSVASAPVETRVDFIRKTYLHLAGAVLALIGLLFGRVFQ